MRSRDEVLREFGRKDCVDNTGSRVEWLAKPWVQITDAMADRIRELEAQRAASEPVAWALYDYDLTEVVNLTAIADVAQRWRLGYGYTRVVPLYAHPSAAAVSEPVSNAYTLPTTVQAVVDAANAYEQWQGKWYDYTVASGEKPAKQQRALIEAVRKHRAALTAASEGASA